MLNEYFRSKGCSETSTIVAYVAELRQGPPETVSWCPASSQEKTSWTGVSWGDD